MLVEGGSVSGGPRSGVIPEQAVSAVLNAIRETDIAGWYEYGSLLGVIFTEITRQDGNAVIEVLRDKITCAIQKTLGSDQVANLNLCFYLHPDEPGSDRPPTLTSVFYPDLKDQNSDHKIGLRLKRAFDITASAFGLLICSPLFLGIALLIKMTSKGPVLFRQKRIGLHGKEFTFYKFRSMQAANDHSIHQEYVKQLISSNAQAGAKENQAPAYKLMNDPRITKVGRYLRKLSLDELPQLFNVVRGEMSLVGPRPPVPYEFAAYSAWHKNRLLNVKPGITGLWQVAGRSRVSFDEMVRLDLRYAHSWSLRLDFTILLHTPRAVLSGDGAY